MPGKTSGEVRLFRRSYLRSTVNGSPFSEKNGFKFHDASCKKKEALFLKRY